MLEFMNFSFRQDGILAHKPSAAISRQLFIHNNSFGFLMEDFYR